jgi:hypothetical protein
MKKVSTNTTHSDSDNMRAEYDFSGGIRGKHYRAMQAGYTITIHHADGTTEVKEVDSQEGVVVLAPDVREYFPDSESVNTALRALIKLIPKKRHPAGKRRQATDTRE